MEDIVLSAAKGTLERNAEADFAPLRAEGETIGVLEIRPGQIADVIRLMQIADVAGARVSGLLAVQRLRERLPNVPTAEYGQEIQEVISTFAAQAKRQLEHDRLSIYLLTPNGTALERFAVASSPIVPGEGDIIPLEQVGITRVVKTNMPLVSPDFGRDNRILGLEDSIIARAGFHGLVSVPLRIGTTPFGILNFVSKTANFYGEADIPVAQQIADQIAVFLQNLRLQQAIRGAGEREATARERNRVAHEFHDTLAQALSDIATRASALADDPSLSAQGAVLEHVAAIRDLSRSALDEARRSLENMLPSQLEESSLAECIERSVAQLQQEDRLSTSLSITGAINRLPKTAQAAIFRIFSEAITNVRRHAGATAVDVRITDSPEGFQMSIHDNGRGMSFDTAQGDVRMLGIETMRDRGRDLGGRVVINSTPGAGTEVFLDVPAAHQESRSQVEKHGTALELTRVTRVLIVDDQPTFRDGLRHLINQRSDLRLVGEAGNGNEALAEIALKRPDVVLLDIDLPDVSGIHLVRRIAETSPSTAVVMMSAHAESQNVVVALSAGARGYVQKSANPSAFLDAIQTAMSGEMVLTPGALASPRNAHEKLTPRELRILKGIAQGKTNAEIGRDVYLADKTVERIVSTITMKLRAKNRSHAVAKGIAWKLVEPATADGTPES